MTEMPASLSPDTPDDLEDFRQRAIDMLLERQPGLALCGLGLDGRIRHWHASAERLLGHATRDILGSRFERLVPAEQRRQSAVARLLFRASAAGEVTTDFALLTREGQRQPCRIDIRRQAGDAAGFVAMISEAGPEFTRPHPVQAPTDTQAAHRANLVLIKGEPGWLGLGLELEIDHVSALAAERLEIDPSDWLGRPLWELLVPGNGTDWHMLLHKTLESGKPQRINAVPVSGEQRMSWPVSVMALHESDDGVLGGFTLALGHPEQDADRRTAPRVGERQSDERAWFHAVVHDLREPLRRVREYVDSLQHEPDVNLNATATDYLGRIDGAIERLQQSVSATLRLARLDSMPDQYQSVALDAVIFAAADDLEVMVKQHRAQVRIGQLGEVVGDAAQLRLLFQNLIDNSLRYRRDDVSPEIEINRFDESAEADLVTIVYRDNARGFADPETVLEGGEQRAVHGTGIGLELCRRICRRHRGDLRIHQTGHQGSTLIITLNADSDPDTNESETEHDH
ncbi:ATP-binding protein [Salinisphaera sp. SPP-AMP-43]|uniref:sensor histidine kinase n=1 Tax=Salinisphaera sp. SPP-AMP-43 TaxID=3121288 RepID=UPI003C6E8D42